MSFGNDPWSDRIAKINDDGPRRALLAEIGLWRASRLTDIQAARQATYALSRLHWLLREREAAEREARQLISLCQTPPRASGEDLDAAKGWLKSLGAKVPKVAPPPRRERERPSRERKPKKRSERPQQSEAPTKMDDALAAADAGKHADALKLLRGKRGGRSELLRVWIHLTRALENSDAEALRAELQQLAGRIRGQLGPGALDVLPERPARGERKAASEKPAPKPKEESGPSPRELARQRTDALKALLTADPAPTVEALTAQLSEWPRLWRAIASAERWDLAEERMVCLLRAVDAASEGDRTIPGGTSLLVRMAAAGSEAARGLLLEAPTSARYGGEGTAEVVDLASAAHADGWVVDRILRGPTRKEADRHEVLKAVGEAMDGLWRLILRRGEAKAELWWVAALPAEGRAGVPVLLLEDHARVISLPIDAELLEWYGSLEGPPAIGWTGDEGDAVREALAAL